MITEPSIKHLDIDNMEEHYLKNKECYDHAFPNAPADKMINYLSGVVTKRSDNFKLKLFLIEKKIKLKNKFQKEMEFIDKQIKALSWEILIKR